MDLFRLGWKSGGLVWDALNQLWQADSKERSTRNPQVPTMALESPAPFGNLCYSRLPALIPLAIGAVFIAPNLVARTAAAAAPPVVNLPTLSAPDHRSLPATSESPNLVLRHGVGVVTVIRPATFGQRQGPRQVIAIQQPNVTAATLSLVAVPDPFIPVQHITLPAPRWQNPFLFPNLALSSPDTTVFRDPLYGRQYGPRQVVAAQQSPNLLATTLSAVAVAPFIPVSQATPTSARWQPANTSTSSAKPLIDDAQIPVSYETTGTPLRYPFLPDDTSIGVPKTLIADAQLPVFVPSSQVIPELQWILSSTTTYQPLTLAAVVAPFITPTHVSPQVRRDQPINTSAGTPKTLIADTQLPVFVTPPQAVSRLQWPPSSTTTYQPLTLVAAPIIVPAHLSPQARRDQPINTSAGTPKTLIVDTQLPIFVPQSTNIQRLSLSSSTSSYQPLPLVVIAAPFFSPQLANLQRPLGQPVNTSAGTPKTLIADRQLPFAASQLVSVQRLRWVPSNTTTYQPLTLVVIVAPFVPSAHASPQALHGQVANTSAGTPLTLIADVPLTSTIYVSPQLLRGQPINTSAGTPKTLIDDAQAPFFVVPHFAPIRHWFQPQHFNYGTSKTLIEDAQLPFVTPLNNLVPQLQWLPSNTTAYQPLPLSVVIPPFVSALTSSVQQPCRQVIDTSASTPITLLSQIPFINPQQSLLGRINLASNTSQSSPVALLDLVALPPGVQSFMIVDHLPVMQPLSFRNSFAPLAVQVYVLDTESRIYTVSAMDCRYTISAMKRKYTVTLVNRRYTIAAVSRTFNVEGPD